MPSLIGRARSDACSGSIGYRHMQIDYDDNGVLFDVALSGPIKGLTYRF